MSKRRKNLNVIEQDEFYENEIEAEAIEDEQPAKKKWSLKKKLLIGGAAITGLIVGAIALMTKSDNDECEDNELSAEDFEDQNQFATIRDLENLKSSLSGDSDPEGTDESK